MCLGQFYTLKEKKNRRMHRETALEMISLLGSQNNWIRLAFGILLNARPAEFLKLFVQNDTQQLACLVIYMYSRWLLDLSPQTIP